MKKNGVLMDFHLKVFESQRISTRASRELPARKLTRTKKVRGPESPLYTAVCPLVYAIRIFGLAPYEFHNDTLIPSSINSVYAYVCIALHTYIIYTILLRFMGIEMEKPLLGHTETGKAACNYFMAIFDIVLTMFSREKFVRIWNVMQDYDEIVRNLGYARNERVTCVWTWLILCANILIWVAVNKLGMYAFGESWLNNVAYLLVYVATSVSVIKFCGLVILLGQRFEHLNVVAKKSGPLASRWLLASPTVDSKDIEYLHNLLMLASESLNSLYSWSLLMWLTNLSLHVVSDLYFLIQRMMTYYWTLTEWRIMSCLIAWLVAFMAQLVLLAYACHFAAGEANCMGYIMINWRRWIRGSSRNRYENVETSIHLINRRLNFSAAGCFHVNLPLLRSIAALLTTYLVILLQFPDE